MHLPLSDLLQNPKPGRPLESSIWDDATVDNYTLFSKASLSIRICSNVQLCQKFPFEHVRPTVANCEVFGQWAISVRCLGNLCKICKWEQINAGMCHRLVSWHLTWQLTTLWQHCVICNILIKLGHACDDDDDEDGDICLWWRWWWWEPFLWGCSLLELKSLKV